MKVLVPAILVPLGVIAFVAVMIVALGELLLALEGDMAVGGALVLLVLISVGAFVAAKRFS
jgi:hypothetical protein